MSVTLRVETAASLLALHVLYGVQHGAELREFVDADLLEFAVEAVERDLVRHPSVRREAKRGVFVNNHVRILF